MPSLQSAMNSLPTHPATSPSTYGPTCTTSSKAEHIASARNILCLAKKGQALPIAISQQTKVHNENKWIFPSHHRATVTDYRSYLRQTVRMDAWCLVKETNFIRFILPKLPQEVKTSELFGYLRILLYLCTRWWVTKTAGGSSSGVHWMQFVAERRIENGLQIVTRISLNPPNSLHIKKNCFSFQKYKDTYKIVLNKYGRTK